MAVMDAADRRELVDNLALWYANAQAGVQCATTLTPTIIALIKAPNDKPDPPGGP